MVTERKIIRDVVNRFLLKEYVKKATERSGFGGIDIQRNPMGTLVTLIAERPGMVIGDRGKTIKELTAVMEHRFNFDNPQIEVEEEKKPNLNANIMAHKLAVALERGWHFRRAGHSTIRKIMGSGARGCQVILAGKLTGERHRTEKFKDGHIKYCGQPALDTMEIGYAVAKKKLGTIGIKCMIMRPDAVLPDEITILTQEQAKGIVPEAIVEELKIDTSIQEEDAGEIVESLIEQAETDDEASVDEALKAIRKQAAKPVLAPETPAAEIVEKAEEKGETIPVDVKPKTDKQETDDKKAGKKKEVKAKKATTKKTAAKTTTKKVTTKKTAAKTTTKKATTKKTAAKTTTTKATTEKMVAKKTMKKAPAEKTATKKTAKKATTKKTAAKTTTKKATTKKTAAKTTAKKATTKTGETIKAAKKEEVKSKDAEKPVEEDHAK